MKSKDIKYYLAKDPTCAQDVNNLCKKVKKENNFAVFVCLQDTSQVDFSILVLFVQIILFKDSVTVIFVHCFQIL